MVFGQMPYPFRSRFDNCRSRAQKHLFLASSEMRYLDVTVFYMSFSNQPFSEFNYFFLKLLECATCLFVFDRYGKLK